MTIDVTQETPITLASAARLKIWGKPKGINASTIWRWYSKGVGGVRLETVVIGATRHTTEEACLRFIEATTAAANGERTTTSTSARRQKAIDAAEKELAEMGV